MATRSPSDPPKYKKGSQELKAAVARAKEEQLYKRRMKAFSIVTIVSGLIFMPTAIVACVGMLPTIISFIVEPKETKMRTLSIGSLNFAGCFPFLMELWLAGQNFDNSFKIVFDPLAIIIMYLCAGLGYVVDWISTTFMTTILYERGIQREKDIEDRQAYLVTRWGEKVMGHHELDHDGFPIDDES